MAFTPHPKFALTPHPKFGSCGPTPHTPRTTDHHRPVSRKGLAPEKIFYPVQKKRAIPQRSRPVLLPLVCVCRTSIAGPDRPGGHAEPGAGWSQGSHLPVQAAERCISPSGCLVPKGRE